MKNTKSWLVAILVLGIMAASAGISWGVPGMINMQGRLVSKTTGDPITGKKDMVFTFWDAATGGTRLGKISKFDFWEETHSSVPLDNGIFNVIIGSQTAIPDNISEEDNVYLQIVFPQKGLLPEQIFDRQRMVAVPFAFTAKNLKGGKVEAYGDPAGSFESMGYGVYANAPKNYFSGNVGVGTTSPTQLLEVSKSDGTAALSINRADTTIISGNSLGEIVFSGNDDNPGVAGAKIKAVAKGIWSGTVDQPTELRFYTAPDGGTVQQRMVIQESGNVGIGETIPGASLEVAGNIKTGYGATQTYGIQAKGSTAGGSFESSGGNGVLGINTGTSGNAVRGELKDTANPFSAVFGYNLGTGAGVGGQSASGHGVYGKFTGNLWKAGVYGEATGTQGNAIIGKITNTSNPGAAVVGTNLGAGAGVHGESASGNGIYGTSSSSTNAGVFATNTGGGPAVEIREGYIKLPVAENFEVNITSTEMYYYTVTSDGVAGTMTIKSGSRSPGEFTVFNKHVGANSLVFLTLQGSRWGNVGVIAKGNPSLEDPNRGYYKIKYEFTGGSGDMELAYLIINK